MNPIKFFDDKIALANREQINLSFVAIKPSLRIQLRKAGIIAVAIFFSVTSVCIAYSIYNGVVKVSREPLETIDLIFSIGQTAFGCFLFMITCATAYMGIDRYRIIQIQTESYQKISENYPHPEAYLGSISDDIVIGFNPYKFDEVSLRVKIDNWRPFISDFLKNFEPVLLDRYFLLIKINPQERVKHFYKELSEGHCYGYSMALLAKMKNNSKLTSNELKNSISIRDAVFFQLIHKVLFKLNRSVLKSYTIFYCLYRMSENTISFKQYLDDAGFVDQDKNVLEDEKILDEIFNINLTVIKKKYNLFIKSSEIKNFLVFDRLFFNYCNLFSEGMLFHESEFLSKFGSIDNQNEIFFELFQKAEVDLFFKQFHNVEISCVGYVALQICQSNEQNSGHAFFFQISDGYFRFIDSGSLLNHFFEFETKELMIQGLLDYLKVLYDLNYVNLKIIFVGIPHTSSKTSNF